MTEPVAYLNKYLDKSTNITRYKPENQHLLSSDPLYTAEKLHPCMKMTQEEFDEFKQLWGSNDFWSSAENDIVTYTTYEKLRDKIFVNDPEIDVKNTNDFAIIWANFDPQNPEETIEIIPEKKWFVRNKYEEIYLLVEGAYFKNVGEKEIAERFSTKEEAELWTNPLTEAVQLPVEDE